MSETVLLTIENQIATITLNRPQQMNAYNHEMSEQLADVTTRVLQNDNIRAVVLCGAGNLFMAGGDIKFFYEHLDDLSHSVVKIMRELNTTIQALQTMQKPVLAAVHGSVAGVGLSLMLACDLVIAADDTKFTTAYSKIGLSPDGGVTYFLPRILGTKKAMELFLTADVFSALQAKEWGLLNWIVPNTELANQTKKIAQQVATGPTQAFGSTKSLVNNCFENTLAQQFENEIKHFVSNAQSNDFRTGVNAFIHKSKPEFQGK